MATVPDLSGNTPNAEPTNDVQINLPAQVKFDSNNNLLVYDAAGGGGLAQGSTTAGQVGGLIQGAATAAEPTYVEAKTNPLSLTLKGALRVTNFATNAATDGWSNSFIAITNDGGGNFRLPVFGSYYFNGTTWDRQRGDISGTFMQGAVSAGSSDTGRPVKVGGVVNTTVPVLSASQISNLQMDVNGSVKTRNYASFGKSYSASEQISVAAAATDIFTITGNATNTVYVTRLKITALATAATAASVLLIRRSTADTAGTSSTVVAANLDSTDAAPSAVVRAYTANPTLGTTVTSVDKHLLQIMANGSTGQTLYERVFGEVGKPLTLRGINEVLAVNLNGSTISGGTFLITVEWYEI